MYYMGTMTVNVRDETEKEFRETVKRELGEGKGKLGSAVDEAMLKWNIEKNQKDIAARQIALMEKGLYSVGKGWKFNREELYDRR